MNNKNTILKSSMTQGVIWGSLLFLSFFIFYLLGNLFSQGSWFFQNVILIFGSYHFAKKARDHFYGGQINFGRAFFSSMLLVFFSSIILAFGNYLVFRLDNEAFSTYTNVYHETLETLTLDEKMKQAIREMISPAFIAMGIIMDMVLFRGLLFSLITAIAIKKKRP